MIVFSEASSQMEPSASLRDLEKSTEAARIAGAKVYSIPDNFVRCEDAEGALWHVPAQDDETVGIWIGYIPSRERYQAIYHAALARNIRLINSAEEHRRAQELDAAYARLRDLTPRSLTITSVDECPAAAEQIGFPIFVKGVVQSLKADGWKACVAENLPELVRLVTHLLKLDDRTRGKVILRELVALRHSRVTPVGFPVGREFRLFICRQEVAGCGYYWEGQDPLMRLTAEESREVESLALEAAARLDVPYVAVDIGQLDNLRWIVVESGDAQFSGVSQISILKLWHRICEIVGA